MNELKHELKSFMSLTIGVKIAIIILMNSFKKHKITKSEVKYFSPMVFLEKVWHINADGTFYKHFSSTTTYNAKHDNSIIVAVRTIDGCGIIELKNKKFELPKDSLFFFQINQPRKYFTKEDSWDFRWFEFNINSLNFELERLYKLNYTNAEKTTINRIISTQKNKPSAPVIHGYFSLLLTMWFSETFTPNSCYDNQLANVLDYINSNISERININDLAKICFLSSRHFQTVFKKSVGKTPLKYINNLRLQTAETMLISSQETEYQISIKMGFCDLNHFIKSFKQAFGMTPSAYRTKHNKNKPS